MTSYRFHGMQCYLSCVCTKQACMICRWAVGCSAYAGQGACTASRGWQ